MSVTVWLGTTSPLVRRARTPVAPTATAELNGTQAVPLNTSTANVGAGVDGGVTDTDAEVMVRNVNGPLLAGGGLDGSSISKDVTGRLPWLVAVSEKPRVWPGTRPPPVGGFVELLVPPTEMSGFWTSSSPQPVPVAPPLLPPAMLASLQSVSSSPPAADGFSTAWMPSCPEAPDGMLPVNVTVTEVASAPVGQPVKIGRTVVGGAAALKGNVVPSLQVT